MRLRGLLLLAVLTWMAFQTPLPWGRLWLLVPAAVAGALLFAWRFGAWAVLVPVVLFGVGMLLAGPFSLWVWWIPVAALTGVWMGLREEGSGPDAGERAWMLLPALLLAAAMPWSIQYPVLIEKVNHELTTGDAQLLSIGRQLGYGEGRLVDLERTIEEQGRLRTRALPHVLPSVLFVWVALLVGAGRSFSGVTAGLLRWPPLSRAGLRGWRLPDGAIWVLLLGLGLLVAQWRVWAPTAWTLLINAALGYCVQGIAVVESLLLARGIPPSIIALIMVFVFMLAMPVFLMTTVAVGISDVWLDYRRLEPVPDADRT